MYMSDALRKAWVTHGVGCECSNVWLTGFQHPLCKGPREKVSLNVGAETNFLLFQGWIKSIIAKIPLWLSLLILGACALGTGSFPLHSH